MTAQHRPGPYFNYPDGRAASIEAAGLPVSAAGLDVAAWSMSSRLALDGILRSPTLRHLFGWTAARQVALVAAGFWRQLPDAIELVGYLDYNRTRAAIEEIRSANSAAGKARAAKAERDEAGLFASEGW